jgi:hypothetical protein
LAHRGDLPFIRVGAKLLRFRGEDVERYISGRLLRPKRTTSGVA